MTAVAVRTRKLSLYQRITDWISFAQGTPVNLTFWLIAVGAWIGFGPELAHASFIPQWAYSNTWNFPLNTGTSCMELFIGFLVAASTNRSERHLEHTLDGITAQEQRITDVEEKLSEALTLNTRLTQAVHDLTADVHRAVIPAGEKS